MEIPLLPCSRLATNYNCQLRTPNLSNDFSCCSPDNQPQQRGPTANYWIGLNWTRWTVSSSSSIYVVFICCCGHMFTIPLPSTGRLYSYLRCVSKDRLLKVPICTESGTLKRNKYVRYFPMRKSEAFSDRLNFHLMSCVLAHSIHR
jgi:hypothetical protein